jgi:hypothetical protein
MFYGDSSPLRPESQSAVPFGSAIPRHVSGSRSYHGQSGDNPQCSKSRVCGKFEVEVADNLVLQGLRLLKPHKELVSSAIAPLKSGRSRKIRHG